MAIKQTWLYQKRNVQKPWAIFFVKEYSRRTHETTIDWTLYHDDIPSSAHSKTFVGLHFDTVGGYVNAIITEMLDYVEIEASDITQIRREIERILL